MREEILSYLEEIRSHYSTYHNHKEASAWAAVAVFLGLIALFLGALFRHELDVLKEKQLAVSIIATVALVFSIYIWKQFCLCRIAASNVAAAFYLKTQLIGKPKQKIIPGHYDLRPSTEPKLQYLHVLPRAVLEKSDEFKNKGTGERTALEWLAYAMVWLPIAVIIFMLWPLC